MTNHLYKKAAMFGLDARIALAIFGALSVIAGAALYSVLNKLEAVSLLNDLKKTGQAWEQFFMDTNEELPSYWGDHRQTVYLTQPQGNPNWKGPYLKYKQHPTKGQFLKHEKYDEVHILNINSKNWDSAEWRTLGKCTLSTDCYIWTVFNGVTDIDLIKKVDKIVDDNDGRLYGSIRWDSGAPYAIYYKYISVPNGLNL